jgi:hypothetical protein
MKTETCWKEWDFIARYYSLDIMILSQMSYRSLGLNETWEQLSQRTLM